MGLIVYPNPASDYVSIVSTDSRVNSVETEISIYTIEGKLVLKEPYSRKVSVSNISSGLYLLLIQNNQIGMKHVQKLQIK